jgi:hypothetical protein
MRVTLISPEFPFSGRVPMVPPILEYLGALTLREAPETELRLVDANQHRLVPADIDADLVGISVWTATAKWAYALADACHARGRKVVLGGIHASALPDEAMLHADAVVVGEAESCWGDVLRDAAAGRLKRRYDGVQQALAGLPTPLDAGLKGSYRFRAFFTMRGCPYSCTFCSVHHFFGKTIRYRPIPEVVAEVEARAGRVWFNGDDNIWGADPDRAVALFDALAAGTRRSWYGFGDLKSIQGEHGERLLAAARRSGLFSVWVGWESDSPDALRDYRATGKQGTDRVAAVKRMQDHGMEVVLFSVLGGRGDDPESFQRTLELADRLKVGVHPVLLTPLPGTALFEQYRPHLLPGLGWEAFTGVRAVFEHPDPVMTPLAREGAYHELSRELFRPSRILRQLTGISRRGFPGTHLISLMKTLPMKRALRLAREAWQRERPAVASSRSPAHPLTVPIRRTRNAAAGGTAIVAAAGMTAHELATAGLAAVEATTLEALEGGAAFAGWALLGVALAGGAAVRRLRGLQEVPFGEVAPRSRGLRVRLLAAAVLAAAVGLLAHLSRH